ncbi:MAG: hypothetical protein GXO73_12180, partial [Calditrichaeota bacterium]|nr:hypothetical protein [Calditrichota bacterium]
PTSPEINCSFCHAPGQNATKAEVREAILKLHDRKFDTHLFENKPVLCGSCHASNALGTKGQPGVKSLSEAVHGAHARRMGLVKGKIDISCYACHPGPKTRCLRGVMSQRGIVCQDCHGDEATVARSIAEGRQPWLQEPTCESCHGEKLGRATRLKVTDHVYASGFDQLYRNRRGHGGVYCAACHGSPHAILPAGLEKYNRQIERLQGKPGPLKDCTVCHIEKPEGAFEHVGSSL